MMGIVIRRVDVVCISKGIHISRDAGLSYTQRGSLRGKRFAVFSNNRGKSREGWKKTL